LDVSQTAREKGIFLQIPRMITILQEIGFTKALRYVLFSFWQYVFDLMAISPLRVWFLRLFGARIGNNVVIGRIRFMNLYRTGIGGMTIGDYCFLGDGAAFDLAREITLEDHVTVSFDVLVLTHTNVGFTNHPLQKYMPTEAKPVLLKNGCFIGARSLILSGLTVGERAAVAAGAVVTQDVAPGTLVGGVPAKLLRNVK
jgi:acetyltransferase-like isoleucine patch superfamily enzyme